MKRFLKIFDSLEEILAASLFGVMCISVLSQMFSRIFLNKALLYSEEISRFCYIWIVFLCISLGEKTFDHFNVTVFLKFVKGVPNQLLCVLTSLICCMIHIYLCYWSVQFFVFEKVVKSAAMEIPMSVVAAGMVLGFFLGSIRCIINVAGHIRTIGSMESGEKTEGKEA